MIVNQELGKNEYRCLLKASDIAEILNVSKSFVYKVINDGTLRSIRLGKSKRVQYSDLISFIEDLNPHIDVQNLMVYNESR